MTNNQQQTKYIALVISILIFLSLNFGLGPTTLFGMAETMQNLTHYYFGVGTFTIDYLMIALFPFFSVLLLTKRENFSFIELITNSFKILICSLIAFSVGLLILTKIGKHENPLIPEYLLTEPFNLYSTFWIGIGIIIPFLLKNKTEQKIIEIDNIGQKSE
ncbi:hypothetical protein [Flavobacterium suncheonense]|uniref:Uncharacterized protein n=1 Tax=Flavobacterium suncheonense GH29-5 = DSM 17707 TaxID=1121899 RepID=A0A0A2M248_9FLAO|nr:hypothetical protein [Flavobacterium suncheonense]KGO86682.1 hypothetical protein Q764_13490 [Flavobacterium suncheonense GH29-5 = DSM 17707]